MKKGLVIFVILLIISVIVFYLISNVESLNTKKAEKYTESDVVDITAVDFLVLKSDRKVIVEILNDIKFTEREIVVSGSYTPLYVNHKDGLYAYSIYESGIIRLVNNEVTYYAENKNQVEKLLTKLNHLKEKYQDKDSYTIEYNDVYATIKGATVIDLNGSSMIKIIFNNNITNFKVTSLKTDDSVVTSPDLAPPLMEGETLRSINEIVKDAIVVIKYSQSNHPHSIKISFENKYGYKYTIIPTSKDGTIQFVTDAYHKN